jgi:hypothetical protein
MTRVTTIRFSLRTLMLVIGILSLFLALRHFYVNVGASVELGRRVWAMTGLFAILVSGMGISSGSRESIVRPLVLGALSAVIVHSVITIELGIWPMIKHGYWSWDKHLPTAVRSAGYASIVGGVIGLVLIVLCRCAHRLCQYVSSRSQIR